LLVDELRNLMSADATSARHSLSPGAHPWWNIATADSGSGPPEQANDKEPLMQNTRNFIVGTAICLLAALTPAKGVHAQQKTQKYYFKIANIEAQDTKLIPLARDLLEKEVDSRPEFTTDLGGANSEDAQIAEIRRQGMKGYQVSLRIFSVKKEIKPPAPGRRDQQMSINVKLNIFGHTIPGNKMLFNGDGEASLTGEFSERLKDNEEEHFMKTALASALKQAVSTAVANVTNASLDDRKPTKARKNKAKK